MIDWAKPVQVLFVSEWLPATVLKVHGDGSVVVEWRASPTPTLNADVFNDDDADEFIRNAPPEPREWWIILSGSGDITIVRTTREAAESFALRLNQAGAAKPYRVVHTREVLP